MLKSLEAIKEVKRGNIEVLKKEKWLRYLYLSEESHINMERIVSMEELKENQVLNYVEKTLQILDNLEIFQLEIFQTEKYIIEEVLKWSEVAKCGNSYQRSKWLAAGYNLFTHNIGSAQIYLGEEHLYPKEIEDIVYNLILTHGLIGQGIRGEVNFSKNNILYQLLNYDYFKNVSSRDILFGLNECIISSISEELWDDTRENVSEVIEDIVSNKIKELPLEKRIKKLRSVSIKNGENFEEDYIKYIKDKGIEYVFKRIFLSSELWYVEAALHDFSFEEFVKIFLIIYKENNLSQVRHISFEKFMNSIYYQHNGKKKTNVYKKRIIEKYLSCLSLEDILNGKFKENSHLKHSVSIDSNLGDTLFFNFDFFPAGEKLIDFCVEAEKSDTLYEKAIILLFDLFDLRRDKYDRFNNEEEYLNTMNQSIDYKKIILDYIVGKNVLDIGPGGGALMDLIEENLPDKKVMGLDFSKNVIEELQKKKNLEGHNWEVKYGDALSLPQYVEKGSIDTIIFCSIIHELYSYIEFEGKQFNHDTIAKVLRSSFEVLSKGGRIIIRDGIMTEPENQNRIIRFLSEDGMKFLERYSTDFKGRQIQYEVVGQNEVLMLVNDAMEFLYTYTWGEDSYVHEINEQFGYFTPSKYVEFIQSVLGEEANVIECKHFLQDGYDIALSQKIEIFDENKKPVELPDSTCLIVIEKQ